MSKVKIVNCCEVAKTERLQESNRMINDKKFVKNTFSVFGTLLTGLGTGLGQGCTQDW